MNHDRKQPITIEHLLRLKRIERPTPEFWERFDRELRAKQLAALVERRPWWQGFSRGLSHLGRYGLPVGAAAVLAITFISVRQSEPVAALSTSAEAAKEMPSVAAAAVVSPDAGVTASQSSDTPAAVFVAETAPAKTENVADSVPVEAAAGLNSLLAAAWGIQPALNDAVPSRDLSGHFAGAQAEPIGARNLLGVSREMETLAPAAKPVVDPLQQMMTPRDARRAKMLTAMVSMSFKTPAPTERSTKTLPEDRVYDQIHRFSGRGDRFSVKF